MRKTLLLAASLWLGFAMCPVAANDEFVTLSDGRTLVLHDNYTWDIKGKKSSGFSGDITVNVYGDRNIVLHEDRTWDMAGASGATRPRPAQHLSRVSATATSARQTLDEAREAARNAAVRKIVQQLRPHVDTLASPEDSLARCVELSAVFVTIKQVHSRDKGYSVSLRLTLSRPQIDGVLACAARGKDE